MKKIDYDLFAQFKLPFNVTVNENGVFFMLKTTDLSKNRYNLNLCRLENGKEKSLVAVGSPNYWHCGERLIYVEKPDEKKQKERVLPETTLKSVSYDGRTKQSFLKLDYDVSELLFITEDNFYFTANESALVVEALAQNKNNRRKAEKQLAADRDYMVFTESPYWFNGAGVVNGCRTRLYHYAGGTATPVTDQYTSVSGLCANLDRSKIVFSAQSYKEKRGMYDRLYCLDTTNGSIVDITSADNLSMGKCGFLQDGRLVFAASSDDKYGLNQNSDIYIYDFAAQTTIKLYATGDYGFYPSINSDISAGRSMPSPFYEGGDKVYTLITDNDRVVIAGINKASGELSKLADQPGLVSEATLWGNSFYCVAHRGNCGPEICKIDLAGAETQLSWLNAGLSVDYQFVTPVPVCFKNEVGDMIYGFALPPAGCKKGVKYKTVLSVHGGPKTAFGGNLFHEMQLLSAHGYAVIFCNPTGSDGRGDRFADIRGRYGDIDFRDLMKFCDCCVEQIDFVDGDNMAIIGGSYGGFMTNWAIGHTDRFKAAVSQRSISNWITFTTTSDIGDYFGTDQTAGDIWQSHDKMWEQSPLKYADKVKTPTLFIHSDMDFRCPLSEGVSMYSALKHFGVPARMCVFKGENHELSRSGKPQHRIRRLKEIIGWLDKYLV